MTRSLQPGAVVARYRIVSLLGAGGMGEVYLARDESLERSVALKILPPGLVTNEERVRRFVQEAKTASALSHPHIVTIHEIGEADIVEGDAGATAHVHFIAMELVSGHTLKDLIHKERIDLRTLLRYLAQAADGLAKAHAAGIVHRDLKPENIMVTADGYAKVLDFGLAKLVEEPARAADLTSAPTELARPTGAGTILGTVGYMSPEQVQGRTVDHRSDIFSLGCVLYEAAARQRPFRADSDVETLHKILKDKPPPLEELTPQAPGEFRRLVRRCLSKNSDQRLQSMKDLALELAEIADEYDTLSISSGSGSTMTSGPVAARPRSFVEQAGIMATILIGVAGLTVGGWALFGRAGPDDSGAASFTRMQITRLPPVSGLEDAALSPDGRYLALTIGEAGQSRLVVRQLATGTELEVVPRVAGALGSPAFSPDGTYLFYVHDTSAGEGAIYQVATLGGPPRKIQTGDYVVGFVGGFAPSPDGAQVAAVHYAQATGDFTLLVCHTDGTSARTLATFKSPGGVFAPTWSPDGKYIVASVYRPAEQLRAERLVAFSVVDGSETPIGSRTWLVDAMNWLPDGSGLVVASHEVERDGSTSQLWLVSWPDGAARRITNDSNDYGTVSVSADGSTIAAVHDRFVTSSWVAPAGNVAEATRLPGELGSFWRAGTDSMLFVTRENGRGALWTMSQDGSGRRRLTPDRLNVAVVLPAALADVVLVGVWSDDDTPDNWRMDREGGGMQQTANGTGKFFRAVSPDGLTILFNKPGDDSLWKMAAGGGAEEKVSETRRAAPRFSPDGTRFWRYPADVPARGAPTTIEVLTVDGERLTSSLALPADSLDIQWTPAGDGLTFLRTVDGVDNVWRIPIAGGEPRQVTGFTNGRLWDYAFTAGGARLFFTRIEETSNEVLLIRNFR